jgi:hypothetical protein
MTWGRGNSGTDVALVPQQCLYLLNLFICQTGWSRRIRLAFVFRTFPLQHVTTHIALMKTFSRAGVVCRTTCAIGMASVVQFPPVKLSLLPLRPFVGSSVGRREEGGRHRHRHQLHFADSSLFGCVPLCNAYCSKWQQVKFNGTGPERQCCRGHLNLYLQKQPVVGTAEF